MSLTDRDRKILIVLAVVGALAGYWFLLLSPKREEVAKVEGQIAAQVQLRDAAVAQVQAAEAARASFASDYAEIVRLGKAIPTAVDMPSLLVQLDKAAKGTKIDFERMTAGQRTGAAAGGQPASGGAAAPAAGAPPGLDTVPLDFSFTGDFFDLADFFHRLKRFVHVNDGQIVVRGRLMTIDSFTLGRSETGGDLSVSMKATVYLAPKAEGATAGATPSGPAPAPQPPAETAAAPTPPTATVQP